ncbi:Coenzyme F420 hydrogenase/dehydrogenase, beta subunit C-terminal domain [Desulfoscipio sp. XC116]|uniref:Coenzyme F420 hydrogenase/dehydrogenase, beta subunit C-terminal domain n=1 Tax=Desulfoscipio sp. XC116 TaxID=3144975 RepID=UPI00325B8B86
MPGQERLKNDILSGDLCSVCGLCVGLCPYIKTRRDRVRVIYHCGLDEGTCYSVCPKTGLDVEKMDLAVFGRKREDQALGVLQGIYFARALGDKAPGAQYGGVTTALASLALQRGLITGAVLTGGEADNPYPVLARTSGEVHACAGSKYVGVPTLAELNRAVRDGLTGLGVVGRPCQVAAVRKMQQGGLPGAQFNRPGAVELVLGLFCFASLTPDFYGFLAGQVKGEQVVKMDIPEDGPVVETSAGSYHWSMDDLRPYIHKACNLCLDPTSEWADIAVGATEYDRAWNTLLVRSDKGRRLLDLALDKNIIEIKDYPARRLPVLRRATLNKKMRVLASDDYQSGRPGCPVVPEEYRRQLEEQWGGVSQ